MRRCSTIKGVCVVELRALVMTMFITMTNTMQIVITRRPEGASV